LEELKRTKEACANRWSRFKIDILAEGLSFPHIYPIVPLFESIGCFLDITFLGNVLPTVGIE
jgi:hypothetical protein